MVKYNILPHLRLFIQTFPFFILSGVRCSLAVPVAFAALFFSLHAFTHISLFLSRKRNSNSITTSVHASHWFHLEKKMTSVKTWKRNICNSNITSLLIVSITLRLMLIVWIPNEFLSQHISYPIEMKTLRKRTRAWVCVFVHSIHMCPWHFKYTVYAWCVSV